MNGLILLLFDRVSATYVNLGKLQRELLNQFHHSQKINQYDVLMGLKQVTTVTAFREEFENVSASKKQASDGLLSGVFLNGLKEEICTLCNFLNV